MTATRDFVLTAGRPALDLCNTRLGSVDLLTRSDDLARWFVWTGAVDQAPPISASELASARALRDELRPSLLESDGPRAARIAEGWLLDVPGRLRVEPDTLRTRFTPAETTSGCLLVAVTLDALDLVRDSPGRVRECADPECPVLFLDTSRNRSRRWCSMDLCGARSKASTYYRRHRGGPPAQP